ncbi:GNAT family N-acetyltransferase [Anaerosporobacter faecicola]|uniref:GNAT family N-acetyltransferase n=1 Tax=Anaerosporobacter faecicola TaxID=2718714 RepID=UPI00143BD76E|nr:GNAT family N-acetyltransferase [Anaerosporobacter faecicola]
MLKAVIFDMDGVLVDSEPLNLQALIQSVQQFGVQITLDYCNQFIGVSTTETMQKIIDDHNLTCSIEDLILVNKQTKRKMIKEEGYPPIPFVKTFIQDLYRHGIKMAVASSSPEADVLQVTKTLGLYKYFDKIISGDSVKHSKPAPDIFLLTLKELGVSASQAMIIEDSMNGSIAAKAANVKCIGFLNPNSGNQDLSRACVLIESFQDMDYHFIESEYRRAYGLPVEITKTKRLIIRELTIEDIKAMYKIYQDPKVHEFIDDIDDYLEEEIEKHKAYIKNVYSFFGYGLWGVFMKDSNELIGRCGIQNRSIDNKTEIELGYLLDINHWGMGYALECTKAVLSYAFEYLGIQRIVASIDKMNARSLHVAKKLGMQPEKEIMDRCRACILYVITKEDYDKQHQTDEASRRKEAVYRVLSKFDDGIDTSVYKKRYQYRKDEK